MIHSNVNKLSLASFSKVTDYDELIRNAKMNNPHHIEEFNSIISSEQVDGDISKFFTIVKNEFVSAVYKVDGLNLSKDLLSEEFESTRENIRQEVEKLDLALMAHNEDVFNEVDFFVPRMRQSAKDLKSRADKLMHQLTENYSASNSKDDPAWNAFDKALSVKK